jgi:hypothetical protein
MSREIVCQLDREFQSLIESLKQLVRSVPSDLFYRDPPAVSIGENVLRSAAAVEQICGGLTTSLWDDPFEWTLPETLSNSDLIVEYLSEVDLARQRMFKAIGSDEVLSKYVPVPSGEPRPLGGLLLETLVIAGDYRGRAVATIKILSGEGAQRFII